MTYQHPCTFRERYEKIIKFTGIFAARYLLYIHTFDTQWNVCDNERNLMGRVAILLTRQREVNCCKVVKLLLCSCRRAGSCKLLRCELQIFMGEFFQFATKFFGGSLLR